MHRQWSPLAHALAVAGDRWTLLIVLALRDGTTRLGRLKERLPGISAAVLDSHVQRLAEVGVLTRERHRERPPRVELTLTDAGRELLGVAEALARWGMGHVWTDPVPGERVDVPAMLGMLTVLLDPAARLPDASIALILVTNARRHSHLLTVKRHRVQVTDYDGRPVEATVEGDTAAWVAALGPARDASRLLTTGERSLVSSVLRALPAAL